MIHPPPHRKKTLVATEWGDSKTGHLQVQGGETVHSLSLPAERKFTQISPENADFGTLYDGGVDTAFLNDYL